MLLFTMIIDQSIFVEIVRKTMHRKPGDWFDKKRGGGRGGGRGRCRCWGQTSCESVGQFWLCG